MPSVRATDSFKTLSPRSSGALGPFANRNREREKNIQFHFNFLRPCSLALSLRGVLTFSSTRQGGQNLICTKENSRFQLPLIEPKRPQIPARLHSFTRAHTHHTRLITKSGNLTNELRNSCKPDITPKLQTLFTLITLTDTHSIRLSVSLQCLTGY